MLPSGGSLVELTLVQLLGRLIGEAFFGILELSGAGLEGSGRFENIYFLIPYWI